MPTRKRRQVAVILAKKPSRDVFYPSRHARKGSVWTSEGVFFVPLRRDGRAKRSPMFSRSLSKPWLCAQVEEDDANSVAFADALLAPLVQWTSTSKTADNHADSPTEGEAPKVEG
jgi:hypothetical protein